MADDEDEDDYLSDKFLFASASASTSTSHPPISNRNSNRNSNLKSRAQPHQSQTSYLQTQTQLGSQSQVQTYSERRKAAAREAERRNLAGRRASRREREEESRAEGLRVSLFERARREEEEAREREREREREDQKEKEGRLEEGTGLGGGGMGKALGLMRRMGYREGEALGARAAPSSSSSSSHDPAPALEGRDGGEGAFGGKREGSGAQGGELDVRGGARADEDGAPRAGLGLGAASQHRKVPLPVDVWTGKKGVGLGKRAPSPGLAERAAKVLKEEETAKHESYRDRTRSVFEERKILGQLSNATKTLLSLDEKSGIQFNVLALDPQDPTSIPPELLEALAAATGDADDLVHAGGNGRELSYDDGLYPGAAIAGESEKDRLRREMQRDALQPLGGTVSGDDEDGGEEGFAMVANGAEKGKKGSSPAFSDEAISEARTFLQLPPGDRLSRVLNHLRSKYHYCLWCGTQYDDAEDLDSNCPGPDEDAHD